MPRRLLFSEAERNNLHQVPDGHEELARHYTFSDIDLSIIRQHRGAANRLGFAVQLCYMRYPGIFLPADCDPDMHLLSFAADQVKLDPLEWSKYAQRAETRREHILELQTIFGFRSFTNDQIVIAVDSLSEVSWQTDKGIVLAEALTQYLRNQQILLPSVNVIERICAEAITKATRKIYEALIGNLNNNHLQGLESLLAVKEESKITKLS